MISRKLVKNIVILTALSEKAKYIAVSMRIDMQFQFYKWSAKF